MSAPPFDPLAYAKLLKQTLPQTIRTEDQNEHYLGILEGLLSRNSLSQEETQIADLLTVLIERFEEEAYKVKPAPPLAILEHLMDTNELKQKDLVDVFGAESVVSEVLRGKRGLSKEHIRRLSERFHISTDLFLGAPENKARQGLGVHQRLVGVAARRALTKTNSRPRVRSKKPIKASGTHHRKAIGPKVPTK